MKPAVLRLALWSLAFVVAAGIVVQRGSVDSDLSLFLPQGASAEQRLVLEQVQQGPAARLLAVALEGADSRTLARISGEMAAALRASGQFSSVANGSRELAAADRDLLFHYRYLLTPTEGAQHWSTPALRVALEQRLAELASTAGSLQRQTLARDPTAEFRRVAEELWDGHGPRELHGVWFDPEGSRALLLLETAGQGFELDSQQQALAAIRTVFAEVGRDTDAALIVSGPAAFAVSARERIQRETQWFAAAASVAVAVLLLAVYRSPAVLLLSALPLFSGVLAGVAAVVVVFGSVHGITLAFGVTLIGVALDYPIHLLSHRRRSEAFPRTWIRVRPTLTLGVATTAIGYLALLFAGFPGLAQLGVFAAVGLLAALVVTGGLVPYLAPQSMAQTGAAMGHWAPQLLPGGRAWLVPVLAIGMAIALLAAGRMPVWEDNLEHLSPVPAQLKEQDRLLRQALGAPEPGHMLIVPGATREEALARSEALRTPLEQWRAAGAIQGYDMAARYLPSAALQRQRRAALPEPAALQAALHQAVHGLPFRPAAFEPFLADVEAARQIPPLSYEALSGTLLESRVNALLVAGEQGWTALIPLQGVADPLSLSRATGRLELPGVAHLDLREQTGQLVAAYRQRALEVFAIGSLLMLGMLAAGLRSGARLARVAAAPAGAVVVAAALLVATGTALSVFHLVSLLLVVGLGLDYALFLDRLAREPAEEGRTLTALFICAASTVTVFGMLALSSVPVLQAIGGSVALGAALSLLFALLMARRPPSGV